MRCMKLSSSSLVAQPFHYGGDGRLHIVYMGSGYLAAQVTCLSLCI